MPGFISVSAVRVVNSEGTALDVSPGENFTGKSGVIFLGTDPSGLITPLKVTSDGYLTINGSITSFSNQGSANTIDNAWPIKITDGYNNFSLLDSSPLGSEFGLVVRNIPSGTQNIVGIGTSGSPSGGILTIQGVSGGTEIPISATSLPLPTGAATQTTLSTLLTELTFTNRINTLGQKTMINSTPIVIASDQSILPVTATQSGTWTVQPGNTANTTPWLTTINQGGNSASVTASNALKVDGSAVIQPVSGSGNFTVIQSIASNLRAQTSSESSLATSPPNTAMYIAGLVTTANPSYTNNQINVISLTTSGALRTDSSSVTQPVSGTITANQGTANSLTNRWPIIITDGYYTASVKNSSVSPTSTDQSLVVAINPNSFLPQGSIANATLANPNPYIVGGRDSTGTIRSILVDATGQIIFTSNNPQSSTIELSYIDSVAVPGAQANYFYSGIIYTVPSSYVFNCVQFNSSSSDNRVTARVSKFITGGSYNLGTNIFTSSSSFTTPNFGAYLEAEVTTVIGNKNDLTLTATYTNQSGVESRTATANIKKNTPVGYKVIFTLQTGDYGVLSVQNVTRSTANTGIVSIKMGVEFYYQTMSTASQNYILAANNQSLIVAAGESLEISWSSNAAATAERIIKVLGTITPS